MDTTRQLPTVLSFCSGYGGIERGLELAGVEHRVIAYVEIEAFAIANLVNKMENGQLPPAPIYSNLKTFPSHLFRDSVDLITGGYPCQPFSAAGKRQGADDPRHLWPFISHHIGVINPSRVFFENVEGHISLGLSTVLADLEDRGFDATWGIFSAREAGAHHQRKRVFIMADSQSFGRWEGGEQRDFYKTNGRQIGQGSAITPRAGQQPEDLADPHSTRRIQGDEEATGQPPEQPNSDSVQHPPTANAYDEGLQRGIHGEVFDPQGREISTYGRSAECCDWGEWYRRYSWAPEPCVGRVVDGCADRVDRIRLLGNGVVPQTAAKAWTVLSEELEKG